MSTRKTFLRVTDADGLQAQVNKALDFGAIENRATDFTFRMELPAGEMLFSAFYYGGPGYPWSLIFNAEFYDPNA